MATHNDKTTGKRIRASIKPNGAPKSFALEYVYTRETKGTWCFTVPLKEGEQVSGSNAIYLRKSEYPTKPGDTVRATFVID